MKGIRLILLLFSSVVAWAADRPKLSAIPSLIIRAYNTNSAPARDLMEMKESASEVFSHSGIEVEWISCSSVSTAALAPHQALELDIHLFNLASAPDNILSHAMQDSARVLATGGWTGSPGGSLFDTPEAHLIDLSTPSTSRRNRDPGLIYFFLERRAHRDYDRYAFAIGRWIERPGPR
jgi:hypothetical protein